MIKTTSYSYADVKADIEAFLKMNADRFPVLNTFQGSALNQIIEMLAYTSSFVLYKQQVSVGENKLSTAKLQSSVYAIANSLGYNIARPLAPSVEFLYTGATPTTLTRGMEVRNVSYRGVEIPLVYLGETRVVHPQTLIRCYLGRLRNFKIPLVEMDFRNPLEVELEALEKGWYVDNKELWVEKGQSGRISLSKDAEDYLLFQTPVEYTNERGNVTLMLANTNRGYGLNLGKFDNLSAFFLETPGYIDGFAKLVNSLNTGVDYGVATPWRVNAVISPGAEQDDLQTIKELAPAYFTTSRRAVTEKDWEVLLKSHPYISAAKMSSFDRTCCTAEFSYLTKDRRVLTTQECADLEDFLGKYKLAGVPIKLTPATLLRVDLLLLVTLNCSLRDLGDTAGLFEATIDGGIRDILSESSLVIGKPFKVGELLTRISQIGYAGNPVVLRVSVKRVNGDSTITDLTEESVLTLGASEALDLSKARIEFSCS